MRIERLVLGRYGHLSDATLRFPAERGLHIVLGANEAGKSTALAAIGDALFGFPHRSDYAFLHDTKDLRVAVTLRARDGRVGQFVRLKRRKDDLLDGEDRPLPESVLAAFLGGATRERFSRVFGLNAAELREGGAAILEGKGEVGESILQAHTGMGGFRALSDRLGREASQLFGDRRGQRALHAATDAFKAARQALDARSVEPAAYKQQRDAQDRLVAGRSANAQEAEALHVERTRLERIRRTAPALRARARALAERAAMGEVPSLPADAEARRQAALLTRDQAAHDLRREQASAEGLESALAALTVDAALLAEEDAVEALAAEQNRIVAARRDREEQRGIAAQRRRDVEQAGRRLGSSADAQMLAAGVPSALDRAAATRATEAHARLSTLRQTAREAIEAAAQQSSQAQAALAATPSAEPFADLRAAIDAAKAEGRIDDEVRQDAAAVEAAAGLAAHALAALPLWSGGMSALAAAPVPLDAMMAQRAGALQAAETALRTRREQHAACKQTLQDIAAGLLGLSTGGDLPTAAAVAEARDRRDRAWRLIRRHWLEGGDAPSEAELDGLPAATLPDALETLLRTADALADRRAADAERVAAFDQLRARQAQQQALRDAAAAAEATAQQAHGAALAAWDDIWRPAGVVAATPEVMRDWLRQRAAVLALMAREDDARRKLDAATARRAAAWATLAPLLPVETVAAAGRLADLLRAAILVCEARERAAKQQADAAARVQEADAAHAKAERALRKLDADGAAWRDGWGPIAGSLGLAQTASAEDGTLALELWNRIEVVCGEWHAAEGRIADMTRAIDGFVAAAAMLVGRLASDLADEDAHDAIRSLAARLAATQAAAKERARLLKERDEVRKLLATAHEHYERAEATLAGLRSLACAEDDAALQAAIVRAAAHAALSHRIAEREGELAREDRSLGELDADAAGIDLDALPARLAEIEERLRTLADETAAYAGTLADVRASLQEMERGRDAAGAAQDMQNALADAEDVAARYVRLRLAHSLLRAGIDRFRRQQQGPLLSRAGALFARLTDDRYQRLSVEENEAGVLFIVAVRPDGFECPAERLSEGTRDQLYLALRLAAIENAAVRSEPLPFIADDLLVNFDDRRAHAALRVLAEFGAVTQTILFTHHAHIAELADPAAASLHRLPEDVLALV